MIRGVNRPSIFYDLVGLAHGGVVTVGRESDSTIRLDCPEVPFLLSRKHAVVRIMPDGSLVLKELNSTNGTYVAREGEFLRRLRTDETWELQRGDTIGFGGPETIVARSEVPDVTVANPFLFRYTPLEEDDDSAYDSPVAAPRQAAAAGQPQARARKFSEMMDLRSNDQEEDMECEEPSTSSADKESKKAKTAVSAKDIAKVISNHLTCAICHDWLAGAHALSCGHMFCGICLASWLTQRPSCPECRKPSAGVPVRCRSVDNTISDIVEHNLVSPNSRRERRRKQLAWDEVGESVVESWTAAMQQRRQNAAQSAAQHLSHLQGQAAPVAPRGAQVAVGPAPMQALHRASEHGSGPAQVPGHNTRRANGGAVPARQGR